MVPPPWIQLTADHVILQYVFTEKHLHVSGSTQCKPLFKDQVYLQEKCCVRQKKAYTLDTSTELQQSPCCKATHIIILIYRGEIPSLKNEDNLIIAEK